MFKREAKIIIGVSGGPDSVCLLDVLCKLQKKYNLKIIIAHINYNLRGKDSKKDEQFVKNLAKKYSLPLESTQITNYKSQITEDSLRKLRYQFFEKVRRKHKFQFIAVGHNLNDQAETVLARILRGTGLRGLGAIKFSTRSGPTARPKRKADGPLLIRPLLNIPRKEILDYLRKNNIPFRIDKTNLGFNFTRNKIRNKLLPYLEKNFNPNIQKTLYKLSESSSDDYAFISQYSAEWLRREKYLSIAKLIKLQPAIQREVLRQALEKHNPNLRDVESAHIEEIIKIIRSGKKKRQKIILKGLKIERRGDRLDIRKLRVQSSNVKSNPKSK